MSEAGRRVRARKNRILGDAVALCPRCGYARRYLLGVTDAVEGPCPDCGAVLVTTCPECGEPPESVMQVTCRLCGTALRAEHSEAFSTEVRRKPEPRGRAVWEDEAG